MSVDFPEPGEEHRKDSPDTTDDQADTEDLRFEPQTFKITDIAYFAHVEGATYANTIASCAQCCDEFHAHIATCVADGTIEDALMLRGEPGEKMKKLAHQLAETLGGLPKEMHDADVDDERAKAELSRILRAADHERVTLFSMLAPAASNDFVRVSQSGAEQLLNDLYEGVEERVAETGDDPHQLRGVALASAFAEMVNSDLTILGNNLIDEVHRKTLRAAAEKILAEHPLPGLKRQIGKHALDVVKIAAGVTIGAVIAGRFKKDR